MDGVVCDATGQLVHLRSQKEDYIGTRRAFKFDPSTGHNCIVPGMPVVFDVGHDLRGRSKAQNIEVVNWFYPSFTQAELVVINWSPAGGTAEMSCGCHCSLYRDQFKTDLQYVDDPTVLRTGTHLVADVVRRVQTNQDGVVLLKAKNIEILVTTDEQRQALKEKGQCLN